MENGIPNAVLPYHWTVQTLLRFIDSPIYNKGLPTQYLAFHGPSGPIGPQTLSESLGVVNSPPGLLPDVDDPEDVEDGSFPTPVVIPVPPNIYVGVEETGRCYPSFGRHEYGLPIDIDEQKRMELIHVKHKILLGADYLAPIGTDPLRILDIGTGSGLWAMDVADATPSAHVVGVDLAPMAPMAIPPNCVFQTRDVEEDWPWPKNLFDFIYLREPLFCIRDWDKLLNQVYAHLLPGGWVEIACTYMQPVCRGGRGMHAPDSSFTRICNKLMQACAAFGTPMRFPPQLRRYLDAKGFVNVKERIFETPTSPFAPEEWEQKVGLIDTMSLELGTPSFGLRTLSRAFGWSPAETERKMASFKREAMVLRRDAYFQYFVVYGQKPGVDVPASPININQVIQPEVCQVMEPEICQVILPEKSFPPYHFECMPS